jgi:hypothetical protein
MTGQPLILRWQKGWRGGAKFSKSSSHGALENQITGPAPNSNFGQTGQI